MQETPEANKESVVEEPAWRSYLRRFEFILGISLAAIIFLAFLVSFLTGFLSINTVFAKGSTEIVAVNPEIKVVFSEAATDDPPQTLDPGQEQDVAHCRAWLQGGASLSLSILNGYPGYTCTLQTMLENRGQGAVRLYRLEYEIPDGLTIQGPEYPQELILAHGQRAQQDFTVLIKEEADQGGNYDFHIWQVFTPVD
jgi:hypothetical protein